MSFKRNQDGGVAVAERVGADKAEKTVDENTSLNNNKESDSNRPTIYKKEGVFGKKKGLSVFQKIELWIDSEKYADELGDSRKVNWFRSIPFIGMHLAVLGVIWVGWSPFAVLFAAAFYFVRMFAITGIYHRYFSHKTYKTNRFWQLMFALLGAACVQRGPLWWAANHRHHHRYSDTEEDIHSPVRHGFLWSHMGWFTADVSFKTPYEYIKDFAKYPELRFLNRFDILVPFLVGTAIFFLGVFLNSFVPSLGTNGPQMLVWGMFISTVCLFHGTVSINSLMHIFGKKRFETTDNSRNSFLLSLVTLGEGWHNNHHRYPATVRQGFYWWEIDITYYILRCLSFLGIIWDLKPVPKSIYEEVEKTKTKNLSKKASPAKSRKKAS